MSRWTIEEPTAVAFDGVVSLRVRLVSGSITVLATDDAPPVLHVDETSRVPLLVTHEAGILTVSYEDLSWDGLLRWLRPHRRAATLAITVPTGCPVQLGVVTASAVVSDLAARMSIKSMSGDVTLDGVRGKIDAHTVVGDLEATNLTGAVSFTTVSGELGVAGGALDRLAARSVSGRVTADVDLEPSSHVQISTMSGAVTLRLPEAVDAAVDLRTTSGRVNTSFPTLERGDRPGAATAGGTLGDGSGRLSVTSVSGDITLLSRTG
jgi:Putative adhesin